MSLDSLLARSWLQVYSRWRARGSLAVLAYHEVRCPEAFRRQMESLRQHHHPVDLDQVLACFSGGRPLAPGAVLITFDDGHRSLLDGALPVLEEFGFPAVAFVVPGLLDSDRPFWWDEVEYARARGLGCPDLAVLKRLSDGARRRIVDELRVGLGADALRQPQLRADELARLEAAGVEIANHTMSHPCLDRCSASVLEREIEDAHGRLSKLLGREPRVFAYPNGNLDSRASRVLRRLGYRAAFLFDHRLSPRRPRHHKQVSRLRVDAHAPRSRFEIITSGLHPWLFRWRQRLSCAASAARSR